MAAIISEALRVIPAAIKDANRYRSNSIHGFKAMFKIDHAAPFVISILERILNFVRLPNLQPRPSTYQRPSFACVTPDTFHIYSFLGVDPFLVCQFGPFTSFYAAGTAYIFICPTFWAYRPHPEDLPLTERCPEVRENAFLTYPGYEVYNYQSFCIVHELVRFYLQHRSLSGTSNPPEQHDLNGCVWLDVIDSPYNPLSYQTYVASMYTLTLTEFDLCRLPTSY